MNIQKLIGEIEQNHKMREAAYRNFAARYNIPYISLWVLYAVSGAEEICTQQELCRRSSYVKQTIHTAVNYLIKERYADLEAIPGTRNQKKIVLTERGKSFAAELVEPMREAEARGYSVLSEEDQKNYLTMTEKLTKSLCAEIEKL